MVVMNADPPLALPVPVGKAVSEGAVAEAEGAVAEGDAAVSQEAFAQPTSDTKQEITS
jgi:hypothetical protein